MRAASVCSLHTASRTPPIPACCSSRPVRRVSSQQISAAAASASRPAATGRRGCRSAWRRGRGGPLRPRRQPPASAVGAGPSRSSTTSPIDRPQRSNAPASASITHAALDTGQPEAVAAHAHGLDDDAVVVDEGDVEREAHPDRVHPAARPQHQRPLEVVPLQQPAPTRPAHPTPPLWTRAHVPRSSASPPPKHGTPIPRTDLLLCARRRSGSPAAPSLQCRRPGAGDRSPATHDLRGFECPAASSAIGCSARKTRSSSRPAACTSTTSTTSPSWPARRTSSYVRSSRRPRHDHVDRHRRGRGDARRRRRVHRRRPRPGAGAVAVQPDGRPHAAGQRQGALRRRADRRRRRRDPRAGRPTPPRPSIVDYDVLEALVDLEAAIDRRPTLLYEAAGSNVVFDTTALGMPDVTGDEYFADCEVTSRAASSTSASRPCPLEVRGSAAAWIDGRLHQWRRTQHAQGVKGVDRRRQRRRRRPGARHHARRRRRLRRQDRHATPRRSLLGRDQPRRVGRPVRWRETRSESMMALGHGRAQVQYVTIGGSRDGKVTHYRLQVHPGLPARFAEMGTILAPFMTRPMSSGVYDIPNIECRTTSRRHQHHADRRLPRRRPPGGHRRHRAGDGHVRRRDRHGPGRGAPQAT